MKYRDRTNQINDCPEIAIVIADNDPLEKPIFMSHSEYSELMIEAILQYLNVTTITKQLPNGRVKFSLRKCGKKEAPVR